jgi:hypothetical protein
MPGRMVERDIIFLGVEKKKDIEIISSKREFPVFENQRPTNFF